MYGKLCTEFYDADKKYAEKDELSLYEELFAKDDAILEPMCGSGRLLIPLGSFQLLYPRERAYEVLKIFYRWLGPGGRLVLDLFVPWEVLYEHGDSDTSTWYLEHDTESFLVRRFSMKSRNKWIYYGTTHLK